MLLSIKCLILFICIRFSRQVETVLVMMVIISNGLVNISPIYTAENFWHGSDEKSTRTKKIVLITHLHVLFSTLLNDVKL